MPTLYLVATPIGNLEDITLRALRILKEVKLIAAEDTRKTKILLTHYGIKTPLTSYHQHTKKAKLKYLLNLLEEQDLALVSEAGMPAISDPGEELVAAAIERGIQVVCIPGPSAILTALAVAGLSTRQFLYVGFLPRQKSERRQLLSKISALPYTLVLFESPHRLLDTLNEIAVIFGDRRIAICRELTKLHEEVFRGTAGEALGHFREPRGEFTIVIEGSHEAEEAISEEDVEKELRQLREKGVPARQAVTEVAARTGLPKNKVYQIWVRLT